MGSGMAIAEIVKMRMCLGCGACAYLGKDLGVVMRDYPDVGKRPVFPESIPENLDRDMVSVCPGIMIESRADQKRLDSMDDDEILIGPVAGVWEGWASDRETRFSGSSGGIVTALASYCLEKMGMALVVHTGMNKSEPWLNETVISRSRSELLSNSGSRYSPSSPVELAGIIEKSDAACVFIGKPCDAAAMDKLRKIRPALDVKLGLMLSFFCAGVPATNATLQVAGRLGVKDMHGISDLRYRGQGWPGDFRVVFDHGTKASLTYEEAWGMLSQKKRQLRCHLCPDGLGEMSDITGGDAWHRKAEGTDGISLILARTGRGRDIVERAIDDGYLVAEPSSPARVVKAQVLTGRRMVVKARIRGLRLFGLPVPRFPGFGLERAESQASSKELLKEFLGMAKRVLIRGYTKPEPRC